MKKIKNLRDLFIEQGRELYDASRREQKGLSDIRQQVGEPKLKKIIDQQIIVAQEHSSRLENAFEKLKENPNGVKNTCCESMLNRTHRLAKASLNSHVRDAAIINSIQRLNHNKITGYGALTTYAKEIGHQDIALSFHEELEKERAIDRELSELAQQSTNRKAELAEAG